MIRRRRPDGSAKTGLDSICSQGSSAASGPSPHPPLNPYARFPRIRLTDDPLDTVTLPSDSRRYRPGPSPGAASSPAATASGVGSGARRACAPTACPQRTCCHPIDHAERHICSSEAVSWRIRAQVADDRYRSTAGFGLVVGVRHSRLGRNRDGADRDSVRFAGPERWRVHRPASQRLGRVVHRCLLRPRRARASVPARSRIVSVRRCGANSRASQPSRSPMIASSRRPRPGRLPGSADRGPG